MLEPKTDFDSLIAVGEDERRKRSHRRMGCAFATIAMILTPVLGGVWLLYKVTAPPPSNFYGDHYPAADFTIQLNEDGSALISNPVEVPADGACSPRGASVRETSQIGGHWRRTWPAIIVLTADTGEIYSLMAHQYRWAPAWDRVALDVCRSDGTVDTEWLVSFENP